jgi:tRNA(Ile)-lysidine synthase
VNLQKHLGVTLGALGVLPDQKIGVACSGGADSVALVHLLAGTRRDFVVMHVDHGLRPDSSLDAEFVQGVAHELGLAFSMRTVAVAHGDSLEAAARESRYAALRAMASDAGVDHVLTAHTVDDQAETVLMRLMRGATLDSIAPARGIFLRPFLDVTRAELREWLLANGIAWRDDPTNEDPRFERNWVRRTLLPLILERRPGVVDVLARTASRAREDQAVLDSLAADVVEAALVDDVGLLVPNIAVFPTAIARRVIRMGCRSVGADPSDHDVDAVLLARHTLCGQVDVWRLGDGMAFLRAMRILPEPVELPERGELVCEDWGFRVRVGPPSTPWRWRVDVPGVPLEIRSRRPGDRVSTRAGTRKVQDVLVDAKIPRPLRDLVPILATPDGPIAVLGHNASTTSASSVRVVDVEPLEGSWSRELAWMGT